MRAHLVVVAAAAILGCNKDTPAPAQPAPIVASPASATRPTLHEVWALAPADAVIGAVASPTALARLERGALALQQLLASSPELAPFKAEIDRQLTSVLGTAMPTLATAGLSHDKPAAIFGVRDSDAVLVILPVGNHDKFLAVTKGVKGPDGLDTVGELRCKTIKGVYACARDAALLDRVGTGHGELEQRLVDLAGDRGDIEFVGALPFAPIPLAAAVQIDRGAISVRGAASAVPGSIMALLANAKPRTDGDRTAGFAVFNAKPFVGNVTPAQLVPGVTSTALVQAYEGPITVTIATGALAPDVRAAVTDPAPFQKLTDQCDQLPMFSVLGVTVSDHTCHVPVPQYPSLTFDMWVDSNEVRGGRRNAAPGSGRAAMSAAGKELAARDWIVALYGRGLMFGGGWVPQSQVPSITQGFMRVLMVVNELGLGVRVDGDRVRFVANARTLYANPDDVIEKVLAIEPAKVISGEARASLAAIANDAKSSPFATDLAAGYGGIMIPVAGIAGIAGYVLPNLLDDSAPPPTRRRTEVDVQLERLAGNLEAIATKKHAFPKGKAPVTPAKGCCEFKNKQKCDDKAAWQTPVWKAVGFSMDEPHYYRYSYTSNGTMFTATASSDLDCDGIEATWTLTGSVDARGQVTTQIAEPTNMD